MMGLAIAGILIFVVATIGLFVQWLRRSENKKYWGIAAVVGLAAGIGGMIGDINAIYDTPSQTSTPTSTTPAAPAAVQPTAPSPEKTIRSIVYDELGTSNREDIRKVSNIDIVTAGYGYNVDIYYAINDNLKNEWIIGGARTEIRDTMEALYSSGIDIQWVDMYGTFSMVDSYGNAAEKEVMHVRLGRDTAAKIGWENITADMLFNILDFKDIHPAFNK